MRLIRFAGEQDNPGIAGMDGFAKRVPISMAGILNMIEIIHSGAFQAAITERKTAWFYYIDRHVEACTSP